jgi:thiamine biosynthesis lipoprotein
MPRQDNHSVERLHFRALNSDIEFICCGEGAGRRLQRAQRWLRAYEQRFSRFLLLSELSRLNAAAGRPFRASPGLYRLVAAAVELARQSGGLFEPLVLRHLVEAGYDRSFDLLPPVVQPPSATRPAATWRDVVLDPATRTITLPEAEGIDLGGIGKGWAVDRMAAILGRPCLVNGGGDIFAASRPPAEDAWRIGVADPFQPEQDLALLAVVDRGVATSNSLRRRWQSGGSYLHHPIDPRSGRPSTSDAVQVTAVAPSALLADYHAKVALLQGVEGGLAYIEALDGIEALLVRSDGAVLRSSGLGAYEAACDNAPRNPV